MNKSWWQQSNGGKKEHSKNIGLTGLEPTCNGSLWLLDLRSQRFEKLEVRYEMFFQPAWHGKSNGDTVEAIEQQMSQTNH